MADIELVIKIPEEKYDRLMKQMSLDHNFSECKITKLPKGHGRLIDVKQIVTKDECIWNSDGSCTTITTYDIDSTQTIIEADKKYGVEVITRGNCMMCGKPLKDGLFFCEECEAKITEQQEMEE